MRVFQSCWPYIGHISDNVLRVEGNHIFRKIPDRCDTALFRHKNKEVETEEAGTPF